jgi:SAM-dependent methyltransferase
MAEWAHDYFEHGYAQRWALAVPSEVTSPDVDYLWQILRLDTGVPLLDVGCGHGRHAVAFTKRGAAVTGVDFAASLLERARSVARDSAVTVCWARGDMRQLPFRSQSFQAAIMFDAFGFFELEDDNEEALREVARVLAPGGRLGLKVVNAKPILRGFRPADREERDGVVTEIRRTLTLDPPRLTEHLVISGPRGGGRYERRQRLYGIEDLGVALRNAGLMIAAVLSATTGGSFEPTSSPAMVIIGERVAGAA